PTEVYGWLYLVDKFGEERFSEDDEQLAVTLATQLAVSYENIKLYHELKCREVKLQQEIVWRKQVEERIREQAELLDKAHEAIIVRDLDDRILYCNERTLRLYGLSGVVDEPDELKT